MKMTFYKNRWISFFLSLFFLFGCFFFFWKQDRSIGFNYDFFFFLVACFVFCIFGYSFLLFFFSMRDNKLSSSYYSSKYQHSLAVQEILKLKRISFKRCLKRDLEDLQQRKYVTQKDGKYFVTTILKNYDVFDSHLRIITDFMQSQEKSFEDFLTPEFRKCYLKLLQSDMIQAGLLERQGIFLDFLSYIFFLLFIILMIFYSFHGFFLREISVHFGQLVIFFVITCFFQLFCFHVLFKSSYRITSFGKNYSRQ